MIIHPTYQDTYKSSGGAELESLKVFVDPLIHFSVYSAKNHVNIFEFGLGFGSNLLTLLKNKARLPFTWSYFVIDDDPWTLEHPEQTEFIRTLIREKTLKVDGNDINFLQISGLPKVLPVKIDFVFHDPFSSRKNPAGWTKEVFQHYKKLGSDSFFLTTYSSGTNVRKNLSEEGFNIWPMEGLKPKKEFTLATYGNFFSPWNEINQKYQ